MEETGTQIRPSPQPQAELPSRAHLEATEPEPTCRFQEHGNNSMLLQATLFLRDCSTASLWPIMLGQGRTLTHLTLQVLLQTCRKERVFNQAVLGPAIFSLSAVVSLRARLPVFLLFLSCFMLLQFLSCLGSISAAGLAGSPVIKPQFSTLGVCLKTQMPSTSPKLIDPDLWGWSPKMWNKFPMNSDRTGEDKCLQSACVKLTVLVTVNKY